MQMNTKLGEHCNYAVFANGNDVYQAVNGEEVVSPIYTDMFSNIRSMHDAIKLNYSENNSDQNRMLGLLAAIFYARLSGKRVGYDIVNFQNNETASIPQRAIAAYLSGSDIFFGCSNNDKEEILSLSVEGNRMGLITKVDGDPSKAILIPMPTIRVCGNKMEDNPFVTNLLVSETIGDQFQRAGLAVGDIVRDAERKCRVGLSKLKDEYPLISRKIRAYIQINGLATFAMFNSVLSELGGPLSSQEIQREREEVSESNYAGAEQILVRMGINKSASDLAGEFGLSAESINGQTIFSKKLLFTPLYEKKAGDYMFCSETNIFNNRAMAVCPVNNNILPSNLQGVEVKYEYSDKPDPVTVLVSYKDASGGYHRKRYGEAHFMQLNFPVIISTFNDRMGSVKPCTHTYIIDYAEPVDLKLRDDRALENIDAQYE